LLVRRIFSAQGDSVLNLHICAKLTKDASSGDTTIYIKDTEYFETGDTITIRSGVTSETKTIASKTSTSLTLTTGLTNSYKALESFVLSTSKGAFRSLTIDIANNVSRIPTISTSTDVKEIVGLAQDITFSGEILREDKRYYSTALKDPYWISLALEATFPRSSYKIHILLMDCSLTSGAVLRRSEDIDIDTETVEGTAHEIYYDLDAP